MTEPVWIQQLRHDAALKSSFIDTLNSIRSQYEYELRDALHKGNMNTAQISLGKQEALDALLSKIHSYDREEKSRVDYIQKTKGE